MVSAFGGACLMAVSYTHLVVVEKTYAQYVQDIRKATGYLQQELGEQLAADGVNGPAVLLISEDVVQGEQVLALVLSLIHIYEDDGREEE